MAETGSSLNFREEYAKGMAKMVISELRYAGEVPQELCDIIMAETNTDVLEQWGELAGQSDSIEEFEAKMDMYRDGQSGRPYYEARKALDNYGREIGIMASIEAWVYDEIDDEEIERRIMAKYNLIDEEAKAYVLRVKESGQKT